MLDDLAKGARKMGPHLFECAGNANPSNFGLMSVAEWDGVPLAEVVARLKPAPEATGVLVSGFDHIGQVSQRSIVGASWVFPLAALDSLGAFLAVRMNGEPVPADHGRPVRLVVPGWYGCAWIKWVNEIYLVGPDERATSQMVEFAGRTHQSDPHRYARDYAPADIQTAATPVRVEKRRGPGGLDTASWASCGAAPSRSTGWPSASAPTSPSSPSACAQRRGPTRRGISGTTAGSPRRRAPTTSRSACPTPQCHSAASIPATTCGRSRSKRSKADRTSKRLGTREDFPQAPSLKPQALSRL